VNHSLKINEFLRTFLYYCSKKATYNDSHYTWPFLFIKCGCLIPVQFVLVNGNQLKCQRLRRLFALIMLEYS